MQITGCLHEYPGKILHGNQRLITIDSVFVDKQDVHFYMQGANGNNISISNWSKYDAVLSDTAQGEYTVVVEAKYTDANGNDITTIIIPRHFEAKKLFAQKSVDGKLFINGLVGCPYEVKLINENELVSSVTPNDVISMGISQEMGVYSDPDMDISHKLLRDVNGYFIPGYDSYHCFSKIKDYKEQILDKRSVYLSANVKSSGKLKIAWKPDINSLGEFTKEEIELNPRYGKIIAEPITAEPVTGLEVYNPCGVIVGKSGIFKVEVEGCLPSEIVWSAVSKGGQVIFPEGNTGSEVKVKGLLAGDVELQITIPQYDGPKPTFNVKVLSESNVKLTAYVVSNNIGTEPVLSSEEVIYIVDRINEIYKQVGIKYNLEWPTRPAAISAIQNNDFYEIDDEIELQTLQESDYGTGGVEVYFTQWLEFAAGVHWTPRGYANAAQGLTVGINDYDPNLKRFVRKSLENIAQLVAHELGHACGLDDIYIQSSSTYVQIPQSSLPKKIYMPDDWNNGPGPYYYNPVNSYTNKVEELLMFGVENLVFGGSDIPSGKVNGINYSDIFAPIKLGLSDLNRNPIHW